MRYQFIAVLLAALSLASSEALAQGHGKGKTKDPKKDQLERRAKSALHRQDGAARQRAAARKVTHEEARRLRALEHLRKHGHSESEPGKDPSANGKEKRPHPKPTIAQLHEIRARRRAEMAEIDRMRDTALETGDLDLLAQADALEQELQLRYRQDFREWHLQHDNGNHHGWERSKSPTTPPTDPTAPPPTDPTVPTSPPAP